MSVFSANCIDHQKNQRRFSQSALIAIRDLEVDFSKLFKFARVQDCESNQL